MTFEYYATPPQFAWWKFIYHEKPRVALLFGSNRGCLQTITPDGIRSFKPGKMTDIEDFTTVGDGLWRE